MMESKTEMHASTVEALNQELVVLYKERLKLRLRNKLGQLNQTHAIAQTRKRIALIKTILRQKALERGGDSE